MSIKLDYYLTPDTKTNSKWIKDLSIIPKATKLLGSNIGRKLYIISLSNGFLDMTPEAQATKAKIDKWIYIKLNSFCTARKTANRIKRQLMEWEKIFASSDKELIVNPYKDLLQLNSKKPSDQI